MTGPKRAATRTARPGSRIADVQRVLWGWRRENGWRAGLVWDPYQGAYVSPDRQTYWPAP